MKKVIYSFVIFFMLVGTSGANPALILSEENLPPEFMATYDVYKGNIRVGKMQASLKRNGDQLIYKSITIPTGLAALLLGEQEITDRAVLKIIDKSYRSVEFKHKVKGSEKNRNEHYAFDWDNNKANVQYKDREDILDLLPYTFDTFSSQLLLMRKANGENTEMIYSVISKGRLKDYVYKFEPNVFINTKLGKLITNKYVRKKDDEEKTTYLGWYAESLHYIPVRLDKIENEKIDISIQITDVKWL